MHVCLIACSLFRDCNPIILSTLSSIQWNIAVQYNSFTEVLFELRGHFWDCNTVDVYTVALQVFLLFCKNTNTSPFNAQQCKSTQTSSFKNNGTLDVTPLKKNINKNNKNGTLLLTYVRIVYSVQYFKLRVWSHAKLDPFLQYTT